MMLSSLMGPGQQQRPPDQNDPRFQRRGAGLGGNGFQGFPAGMYGPLSNPGLWSLISGQGFGNSAAGFEQAQQSPTAQAAGAVAGPQYLASDYVPPATTAPSPWDFWGGNDVSSLAPPPQTQQLRLQ